MNRIEVLDHGYVEFVESWGSDERIVEAARMSTGKGFQGWGPNAYCKTCGKIQWVLSGAMQGNGTPVDMDAPCVCGETDKETKPGDEKLLAYLYNNNHATPFEMAGMVIEVQAPIFVFREWHRHRAASVNEMSARYAPLPDVNYVPTVERLMIGAGGTNKQAGTVAGSETLTVENAEVFRNNIRQSYVLAEELYQGALRHGVPKELARVHLPVGRYSRMRWSSNLRMIMHFLSLRRAPNAQWEIRQFAEAVGSLVAERFPRTWELFAKGK